MSMSEEMLAAAEALLDEEFNGGEVAEAPEPLVESDAVPAEPVTPALTIDAQGRTHGPDGKFVAPNDEAPEPVEDGSVVDPDEVPAQEVAAEVAASEPVAPAAVEDEIELDAETLGISDDHILFTKYGGDLLKALDALGAGQSTVGSLGNELGDLRKENEALQKLVQQVGSLEARLTPYRSDIDEDPQSLVGEVLQRAAETGHFDEATYEAALAGWAESDPFTAARLDAQVAMARQQAEVQVASQASQAPGNDALAREVDAFKTRHPDLDTALPAMNELAAQRPVLQRALYEGSAEERAQALEDLYTLAKSRSNETATSSAAKRVILRAKADADKAKSDAAVVGASRTSAVTPTAPTGDRLLEQALRSMSGLDDLVIEG